VISVTAAADGRAYLSRRDRRDAMIKIPQPSMALNAPDFPARCTMHATYDVDPKEEADGVLRQVRQAAMRQREGYLRYLVIMAHGKYAMPAGSYFDEPTGGYGISLGKGLYAHNAGVFGLLRKGGPSSDPLVKNIFLASCGASAVSALNGLGDGDGELMCKKFARHSGAMVFGADIVQVFGLDAVGQLPAYHMKDFNGTVKQFSPDGSLVARYTYPRSVFQGFFGLH
jgi:hypothetical protein